jgi:type VI protein secretion system component VasA
MRGIFLIKELFAFQEGFCFVDVVGLNKQTLSVEMLIEMRVGLGPLVVLTCRM